MISTVFPYIIDAALLGEGEGVEAGSHPEQEDQERPVGGHEVTYIL